jgi:hypothetical protein
MRRAAVTQPEEAVKDDSGCRHHWLIESPHGPTSLGVCKLCGARKEFRNSVADLLWEYEPLAELSHGRWGKSRDFHAPTSVGADDDTSAAGMAAAGGSRLV